MTSWTRSRASASFPQIRRAMPEQRRLERENLPEQRRIHASPVAGFQRRRNTWTLAPDRTDGQ